MKYLGVWLISVLYFFALSASLTYLFIPGVLRVSGIGNTVIGILLIVVTVLVWYVSTSYLFKILPPRVSPELNGSTFAENMRGLPKLIGVLVIFGAVFVVLSGLISLLLPRAVFPGNQPLAADLINICVTILAVISLPFYMRTFAGYAGGDRGFLPLLSGNVRLGWLLYLKYLGIGAAAFAIAYLVRYLTYGAAASAGAMSIPMGGVIMHDNAGTLMALVLTSLVLGAALLLAWKVYTVEKDRQEDQNVYEDEAAIVIEGMTER